MKTWAKALAHRLLKVLPKHVIRVPGQSEIPFVPFITVEYDCVQNDLVIAVQPISMAQPLLQNACVRASRARVGSEFHARLKGQLGC